MTFRPLSCFSLYIFMQICQGIRQPVHPFPLVRLFPSLPVIAPSPFHFQCTPRVSIAAKVPIARPDKNTQVSTFCNRTATAARSIVGTQISTGRTRQPLTRFQAFIAQKRQRGLPQKTPTVLVWPLPVVASGLSSCHAHGRNLYAVIFRFAFKKSPRLEQGAIPALKRILVCLPTYPYRDAFLVNAVS